MPPQREEADRSIRQTLSWGGHDLNDAGASDLPLVPGWTEPELSRIKLSLEASDPRLLNPELFRSKDQPAQHGQDVPHTELTAAARKDLAADAEAISKDRFTDRDAINKILETRNNSERNEIDRIYQKQYGISLYHEMSQLESGADLDRFVNILHRDGGDAVSLNATRMHEDLLENNNWIFGRSSGELEKDIRTALSTHNSAQISKMDDYYRQHYGTSLHNAIMKAGVSDATKEMAAIYLRGNDKRTDADTNALINVALKANNLDQFAEVMADASSRVRKEFVDNGGQEKLNTAFAQGSARDRKHAMDYAMYGKLDAATQVSDNTGHVFDNKNGIELALSRMTAGELADYRNGKLLQGGKNVSSLSPEDKQAGKEYYQRLHGALAGVGNATDVARWESMMADSRHGSFIASMARHRGTFYNSGNGEIAKDIANMSQQDWQDSRQHPERRSELDTMLESLGVSENERGKMLSLYDKKMAAESYEQARDAGVESLPDRLAGMWHWYGSDRKGMLDEIAGMSAAEQKRYRDDQAFRTQVDAQVTSLISDSKAEDAAKRMLGQIKIAADPNADPIARIERLNDFGGLRGEEAVRTVDRIFREDAGLTGRIAHPSTADERQFAEQFKKAVEGVLVGDYEGYGKLLLAHGQLPLETKLELDKGVLSNDYNQAFQDIQQASEQEKTMLANDPEYRKKVVGFMSADRQQIALSTMNQTELRAEDRIRAAIVGWGGSSEILKELEQTKPEQLDQIRQEYVRKYGSSFNGDLMVKLGGHDKAEAERALARSLSTQERVSIAKDQTESSRSGLGAWLSDNVFASATGGQADDALNQTDKALSDKNKMEMAAASGTEMASRLTPDQIQAVEQALAQHIVRALDLQNQATDNHAETKQTLAEYGSYAALAAGAAISMLATAGADAPALTALAVAGSGAAIRPATKALLEGSDYDSSMSGQVKDVAIGAATTLATIGSGPVAGRIAAMLGVGQGAAVLGAEIAADQINSLGLVEGGALAEGGAEALRQGAGEVVRSTLSAGRTLSAEAFSRLADKVVLDSIEPSVRAAVVAQLAGSLQANVSQQLASSVIGTIAQNTIAGGYAGGRIGAVAGATEWDEQKDLAENLSNVAAATGRGAAAGAAIGAVVGGASAALRRAAAGGAPVPEQPAAAGDAEPVRTADLSGEQIDTAGNANQADTAGATRRPDTTYDTGRAAGPADPLEDEAALVAGARTPQQSAEPSGKASGAETHSQGQAEGVDSTGQAETAPSEQGKALEQESEQGAAVSSEEGSAKPRMKPKVFRVSPTGEYEELGLIGDPNKDFGPEMTRSTDEGRMQLRGTAIGGKTEAEIIEEFRAKGYTQPLHKNAGGWTMLGPGDPGTNFVERVGARVYLFHPEEALDESAPPMAPAHGGSATAERATPLTSSQITSVVVPQQQQQRK